MAQNVPNTKVLEADLISLGANLIGNYYNFIGP